MSSKEIREKFISFFKERGHAIAASSSLIPDDPSVLLTTAGMQQFKKYYTGELNAQKDFGTKRAASIQKCFRTSDIEEVGDATHDTFFEMLGNFSFGDYFKEEAIRFAYEFLTERMGISPERIHATVFEGDDQVPADEESFAIWKEKIGIPAERIQSYGREDNFWGPTGNEGPCGPTTEIYVDGVEIWNIVFNQYYCSSDGSLESLASHGVDTGMGLERLAKTVQGVDTIFETDLFHPLIAKIRELAPDLDERGQRIIADHLRASIFLIADGLRPSNKEAGYILRRLIRKVLALRVKYDIHPDLFPVAAEIVKTIYGAWYPEVTRTGDILSVLEEESKRFQKTIAQGMKELNKHDLITADIAFQLYETFGLPLEIITELVPKEKQTQLSQKDFDARLKAHQEISRAGSEKKFGGHGLILNTGELKAGTEEELKIVTRLHTATHLLQQALRNVLGPDVQQRGSDITSERTRFDFSFPRKLTDEERAAVEREVNDIIKKNLPVQFKEMKKEDAEKTGALFFFRQKYPEHVKVYYVGPSIEDAYSKEFCGGPHVIETGEIGVFRILKEEAVSAGVRRIRAAVE